MYMQDVSSADRNAYDFYEENRLRFSGSVENFLLQHSFKYATNFPSRIMGFDSIHDSLAYVRYKFCCL